MSRKTLLSVYKFVCCDRYNRCTCNRNSNLYRKNRECLVIERVVSVGHDGVVRAVAIINSLRRNGDVSMTALQCLAPKLGNKIGAIGCIGLTIP